VPFFVKAEFVWGTNLNRTEGELTELLSSWSCNSSSSRAIFDTELIDIDRSSMVSIAELWNSYPDPRADKISMVN
jgi:hypothetical protein